MLPFRFYKQHRDSAERRIIPTRMEMNLPRRQNPAKLPDRRIQKFQRRFFSYTLTNNPTQVNNIRRILNIIGILTLKINKVRKIVNLKTKPKNIDLLLEDLEKRQFVFFNRMMPFIIGSRLNQ